MILHFYKTLSGKNLIFDFINTLSKEEKAEAFYILSILEEGSKDLLIHLDTKHFHEKIYEIKFRKHNRLFYILKDDRNMYILHGCKKQKNKAELKDKNLVIKRSKEII